MTPESTALARPRSLVGSSSSDRRPPMPRCRPAARRRPSPRLPSEPRVRWRPGFVTIVLLAYAACRLVSAAILVSGGRRPGADRLDRAGGDLPVLHPAVGRAVVPAGHGHGLPEHPAGRRRGTVQQNAWAFYPLYPSSPRRWSCSPRRTRCWSPRRSRWSSALPQRYCSGAASPPDRPGQRAARRRRLGEYAGQPGPQVAYTESLAMVPSPASSSPWRPVAGPPRRRSHCSPGWPAPSPPRWPSGTGRRGAALAVGPRRRGPAGPFRGAWAGRAGRRVRSLGLIWPGIAALATGVPTAYTDTMSAWRGSGTITPLRPWLDNARYFFGEDRGAGPARLRRHRLRRQPGPWAAASAPRCAPGVAYPAYLFVVLDPVTSLFRYLVPIVPLAAVATLAAGRRGGMPGTPGPDEWRSLRGHVLVATVLVVAVSIAGQYLWTHELWRFVPPSDWPP